MEWLRSHMGSGQHRGCQGKVELNGLLRGLPDLDWFDSGSLRSNRFNQPMDQPVHGSTGQDQSTPVNPLSTPISGGQRRSTPIFLAPVCHKKTNGDSRISRIQTTENFAD
ncbi:hypothetical protein PIB30_082104 [Stylosanthes scabra]|uniref:Uncharacterized protein n=1 Tax=Stylosanthes scabra TaxID=79078 RepID=A0ABU6YTQ3_9FABA|nr:hypothetical protein [Stylosanthes scabra]